MDIQDRNQLSQDGFKEFPRSLPDNCVEYMLFVLDNNLEPRSLLAELENVRKAAMQLCLVIAKDYIWQRDSFQLQIKREDGLVYLHGTTDYGDSIEDEWLIVYLLRCLTNNFPSLWVRVFDSDGEFLLIEAANVVPKWLSPEIDSNRAWIHQGKLQLVPMSASIGPNRPLSLAEAISFILLRPSALVHSPFIEAEAFYRLEKYPDNIKTSLHHSLITIPRKLAYILHEQPAAIAPAIESFYLRDAVTLRPLSASPSELHFPPKDLVTVSVRFTKVLFAQVRSQQFAAPPLWSSIVKPIDQSPTLGSEEDQKISARLDLGMKVTSGFEMLAACADGKDNRLAREFAILLEDVEEDGNKALPSDDDIAAWPWADRDDNETWMDINFEDFENELQGNQRHKAGQKNGFGDAKAQADLRKIVSRFEDFLNDETAGPEGAELDEMDHDNDSSDQEQARGEDDDESSEDEDKAVSFDEDQFDSMMKEMMGVSENQADFSAAHPQKNLPNQGDDAIQEDDEDDEIRKLSAQMEAELKAHGALELDAKSSRARLLGSKESTNRTGKNKDNNQAAEEESGDDEVDIDYNLAKNLLESFKSQGGLAGPAGNMIGMMGMKLPRDEGADEEEKEEEEEREKGKGKEKKKKGALVERKGK
ncbi:SGT1-domain-containing protein [Xylaria nigripes]|nr:SGT1-domain-containing protein [Xylaria nigripes]